MDGGVVTRHWLEAYVDQDCVSFNLICEHPKACMETGEQWRQQGCALLDFFAEYRTELLDFPADRKDVIGQIEVAAQWTGAGEDSDLRLTPVPVTASTEPQPRDNSDLPVHQVAMVLFTTVHAVDNLDAAAVARVAIVSALKDSMVVRPHAPATIMARFRDASVPVQVHEVMDLGVAGGNGYVWIKPTSKAYREGS